MFPPRERSGRQSSATNREIQGHLERRGSRRRRRRPSARSGRGSPPPSSSPASTPPAAAARPLLHPAPAPRVPLTRIVTLLYFFLAYRWVSHIYFLHFFLVYRWVSHIGGFHILIHGNGLSSFGFVDLKKFKSRC